LPAPPFCADAGDAQGHRRTRCGKPAGANGTGRHRAVKWVPTERLNCVRNGTGPDSVGRSSDDRGNRGSTRGHARTVSAVGGYRRAVPTRRLPPNNGRDGKVCPRGSLDGYHTRSWSGSHQGFRGRGEAGNDVTARRPTPSLHPGAPGPGCRSASMNATSGA